MICKRHDSDIPFGLLAASDAKEFLESKGYVFNDYCNPISFPNSAPNLMGLTYLNLCKLSGENFVIPYLTKKGYTESHAPALIDDFVWTELEMLTNSPGCYICHYNLYKEHVNLHI